MTKTRAPMERMKKMIPMMMMIAFLVNPVVIIPS